MFSTKQLKKRLQSLKAEIHDHKRIAWRDQNSDHHYIVSELQLAEDKIERAIYTIEQCNDRLKGQG
jgi:hypothetical protein